MLVPMRFFKSPSNSSAAIFHQKNSQLKIFPRSLYVGTHFEFWNTFSVSLSLKRSKKADFYNNLHLSACSVKKSSIFTFLPTIELSKIYCFLNQFQKSTVFPVKIIPGQINGLLSLFRRAYMSVPTVWY